MQHQHIYIYFEILFNRLIKIKTTLAKKVKIFNNKINIKKLPREPKL